MTNWEVEYHDSVEVEEGWWDGPTYTIKLGGNDEGLIAQSITIMGDAAARQIVALLRQQIEKPTAFNPAEGFYHVEAK